MVYTRETTTVDYLRFYRISTFTFIVYFERCSFVYNLFNDFSVSSYTYTYIHTYTYIRYIHEHKVLGLLLSVIGVWMRVRHLTWHCHVPVTVVTGPWSAQFSSL